MMYAYKIYMGDAIIRTGKMSAIRSGDVLALCRRSYKCREKLSLRKITDTEFIYINSNKETILSVYFEQTDETGYEKICSHCGKKFMGSYRQKVCPECASIPAIKQQEEERRQKIYNERGLEKRRCHDCGKPTNNYRCNACWEKIRGRSEAGLDEDMIYKSFEG